MYQSKNHLLAGLLAVSLLAAFSAVAAFGQTFRVEGAGLEASPTNYSGRCPVVINFKGKIQANRKGLVKYTWIRSDGATAPVESLVFESAGVKYVSTTWTLGDARVLPTYEGTEKIKILSPNELFSNEVGFKIQCTQTNSAANNFGNDSAVTGFLRKNGDFPIFPPM